MQVLHYTVSLRYNAAIFDVPTIVVPDLTCKDGECNIFCESKVQFAVVVTRSIFSKIFTIDTPWLAR